MSDWNFDVNEVKINVRSSNPVPGRALIRIDSIDDITTDKGKNLTRFTGTVVKQTYRVDDDTIATELRGQADLRTGEEVSWIISKNDLVMWKQTVVRTVMVMTGHNTPQDLMQDAEAMAALAKTASGSDSPWAGYVIELSTKWIIPTADRVNQADRTHSIENLLPGRKGMLVSDVTACPTVAELKEMGLSDREASFVPELLEATA